MGWMALRSLTGFTVVGLAVFGVACNGGSTTSSSSGGISPAAAQQPPPVIPAPVTPGPSVVPTLTAPSVLPALTTPEPIVLPTTSPPDPGVLTTPSTAPAPTCTLETDPPAVAPPPNPDFGDLLVKPIAVAARTPRPMSGGTMIVLDDHNTVVVSDPDLDQLYVVDLAAKKSSTLLLQAGDEPGRLAQDASGRVHVVLRSGGALVTIDPKTQTVTARRDACPAPRGVTYQPKGDLVLVACTGGELVSFPAAGGAAIRTLTLEPDLRDVVVDKLGQVYVSLFRKAEVLAIADDGTISQRMRPPSGMAPVGGKQKMVSPSVAWRMLASPDATGGVLLLHQMGVDDPIDLVHMDDPTAMSPAVRRPYVGKLGCPGVIGTLVTALSKDKPNGSVPARLGYAQMSFAVDLALSADGGQIAFAVAGDSTAPQGSPVEEMATNRAVTDVSECPHLSFASHLAPKGDVVAVAYIGIDTPAPYGPTPIKPFLTQARYPALLLRSDDNVEIPLGTNSTSLADTGHMLFHLNPGTGVACASCHPEGGEDGRAWNFGCAGSRRTQSLRGGIMSTAPFHWDGAETTFAHLVDNVFTSRMGGPLLSADHKAALQSWVGALPPLPKARGLDPAAVARGQALFNDARVACASCHAGELLTNNATVDVGTGQALQVPSLRGVSWRTPLMHTGCAATLADRFNPACGGGDNHGVTSTLTAAQVNDLITYLKSL